MPTFIGFGWFISIYFEVIDIQFNQKIVNI